MRSQIIAMMGSYDLENDDCTATEMPTNVAAAATGN